MTTPRKAVASAVNKLSDGLNPDNDADLSEAASQVRDTLVLLLEREDFGVERQAGVGARVKVKMQRGTSPRDQDEWTIVGKGADAEEAQREFDELLERYVDEYADEVRHINPYDEA